MLMEILSPAGSFDMVVAAVQNGATAVYLGMKSFSARQNAKNFDEQELEQAVKYCHARGVLVYLAINTVMFNNQFPELCNAITFASQVGVDALITQDLAVLHLTKAISPDMPLHASTQMTIHTVHGAMQAKEMGFCRVVLSRELSLDQIKQITSQVGIETEVFVHGALCMSVSGQCYMSSFIGTRSGNRGSCAGTCRLPFSIDSTTSYSLSLKDLCLADKINALKQAGVTSLKIEGRMKRPEYAAATAKAYHNAVKSLPYDINILSQVFSRGGFTTGYFDSKVDQSMYGTREKEDVVLTSNSLLSTIQNTYKKEGDLVGISMNFTAKQNTPLSLTVIDQDNNTVTVTDSIPQLAKNKPTTQKQVEEHLLKLGDFYFYCSSYDINFSLDDSLFLPASVINKLRRTACEQLHQIRATSKSLQTKPYTYDIAPNLKPHTPALWVRLQSLKQLTPYIISKAEKIILPIDIIANSPSVLNEIHDKLIIEPYRVLFGTGTEEDIFNKLSILKKQGYNTLMVSNLSHLHIGANLNFKLIGDSFLNCTNSLALEEYTNRGIECMTLSNELAVNKSKNLNSSIPIGFVGYGYIPLMITRNCPVKNQLPCSKCHGEQVLTDKTGAKFKVLCNNRRYSEVLNSTPLYLADKLDDFTHFDYITLYFTCESSSEVDHIFSCYEQGLPLDKSFTRGLYYRGVQ